MQSGEHSGGGSSVSAGGELSLSGRRSYGIRGFISVVLGEAEVVDVETSVVLRVDPGDEFGVQALGGSAKPGQELVCSSEAIPEV